MRGASLTRHNAHLGRSADRAETTTFVDETPPANNFGRKSTASSKNGGIIKSTEPTGRLSETRAAKQEDAIRQAYQNLNRRPPKKSGPTGTGTGTTSTNTANLNQTKSGNTTNLNQTKGTKKK